LHKTQSYVYNSINLGATIKQIFERTKGGVRP
jgi:hypothetical protein